MNVKLLTEHHLEFLSLKGGRTGLSESVKMAHCWKSHAATQINFMYHFLMGWPLHYCFLTASGLLIYKHNSPWN